jgi:hypothetical protein
MDVGDWLRSLGLGPHEALFRENEIDAEVLPELTDGDLEKIGGGWTKPWTKFRAFGPSVRNYRRLCRKIGGARWIRTIGMDLHTTQSPST